MKVNSVMKNKTDQQVLHPVQKHFQQQFQQQQSSSQLSKNLPSENLKEFQQLDHQNHENVYSENTSNKFISPIKPAQSSSGAYPSSKQKQHDKQYEEHQQQLRQQYSNQGQSQQPQHQQQFEEYSEEEEVTEEHLPEEMTQEEERLYAQAQMEQLSNQLHENNQNINGNSANIGNTGHSNSHSNNSFSSAEEQVVDDTAAKEDSEEVDKFAQKQLVSDPDKYFEKIIELNDVAALKLNDGQQKEALSILFKAEKMLEFAASCGKVIDRNLIIVVLYNRACAYQSLWILDKCSKYIDGVIYNLEMSLKEEDSQDEIHSIMNDSAREGLNSQKSTKRSKQLDRELLAYKIKKQTFLVKSYLQCCAILSQQGFHVKALETANEGANVLKKIFKECFEFCRDTIKENEQNFNSSTMLKSPRQTFSNGLGQNQNGNNNMNSGRQQNQGNSMKSSQNSSLQQQPNQQQQQQAALAAGGYKTNPQQPYHLNQNGGPNYFHKDNQGTGSVAQQNGQMPTDYSIDSIMSSRKSMQQAKEEVQFQKLVVEYAFSILQDIQTLIINDDSEKSQQQHYKEAKKSLYFWKNNPENNEKHIRQELNVPTKLNEEETRSILGVQNGSEWIEGFNIGSIMHMIPVQYEEFSFFGDVMYEISKKMILEKVIYLSISYFTIATEIRFIEIDKNKNQNQKGDGSKNLDTEGFKQSQICHLKSIQIVCKHITCKSPYINHLITSYHKHYNQNLETILEESFISAGDNTVTGNNNNNPEILANSQQFDGFNQSTNNQQLSQSQQQQQMSILQPGEDSLQEGQRFEELVNIFVNGMSEDDQTPNYLPPNNPLVLSGANGINQSTSNLHNITNKKPAVAVTQPKAQMINPVETKKNSNQEPIEKKKHSKNSQSARASTSSSNSKKNHHSSLQQQSQQQSGSQSSRPVAYFPSTNKQSFRKEKKNINSNKSTNSTSKTPINIDFNTHPILVSPLLSPSSQQSTQQQQQQQHLQQQYLQHLQQHNQQTSINSSLALQLLHKNIGQFFSNDNSQRNTPRGIFNIRKSTPTVESSNSQDIILQTEPSSHSQPRNPPKFTKKTKESYSNKTSTKISMENVTEMLKSNLIASYSRTFLAQQNGPLQLSQSKSAISQNSSQSQNIKLPTSSGQHRSNIPLNIEQINSSQKLKEKMHSEQSEQRQGQIERIMTQQSSKQVSSLQSSKPSTATSQNARQKKQMQQQQKVQSSEFNDNESQGMTSQQALQEDLRNKLNPGNSIRQQIKNYPKEAKPNKEKQSQGVSGTNGNLNAQIDAKRSVLESIEPFQQGYQDKQNNIDNQIPFSSLTSSVQLKSSNLLSIKNLDKETLQQLLKESSNIPKLNLHGLKSEDVKFYSPRGPTKSALPSQKQLF